MVGLSGFEPLTSRLSAVRSSQLSYRPGGGHLRPFAAAPCSRECLEAGSQRARARRLRPREWLPENWVDEMGFRRERPCGIL
jgi:hypothetical protein